MSLINKMGKYGATPLLPNGGLLNGGPGIIEPHYIQPRRGGTGLPAYMGDPGIFGDIWGAVKGVGRVATGIVSKLGIPVVSGVAGGLGSMFFGRNAIPGASTQPLLPPPVVMPPWPVALPGSSYPTLAPGAARGFTVDPLAILPGGRPFISPAGAAYPAAVRAGGYHLNKSSYFLMDGTFIEKETRWVKNRRRNPGNMRALSRSLGRIKSAKRMTKALSAVTIRSTCPHSHGGKKKK